MSLAWMEPQVLHKQTKYTKRHHITTFACVRESKTVTLVKLVGRIALTNSYRRLKRRDG